MQVGFGATRSRCPDDEANRGYALFAPNLDGSYALLWEVFQIDFGPALFLPVSTIGFDTTVILRIYPVDGGRFDYVLGAPVYKNNTEYGSISGGRPRRPGG